MVVFAIVTPMAGIAESGSLTPGLNWDYGRRVLRACDSRRERRGRPTSEGRVKSDSRRL
jgi:hypothetical protein